MSDLQSFLEYGITPVAIQALEDWHLGLPIAEPMEKMLAEIWVGHQEGQSSSALSRTLGIDRLTVELVIKRKGELESKPAPKSISIPSSLLAELIEAINPNDQDLIDLRRHAMCYVPDESRGRLYERLTEINAGDTCLPWPSDGR